MPFYRVIREYRILLPMDISADSLSMFERRLLRHFQDKDPKVAMNMRSAEVLVGDFRLYVLTIKTRQPTTSFIQGMLAAYEGRLEEV